MHFMPITLDTSQDDILLFSTDAERNMRYTSVTLDTSQEDRALLKSNTERKVWYISVTTNPDAECSCGGNDSDDISTKGDDPVETIIGGK